MFVENACQKNKILRLCSTERGKKAGGFERASKCGLTSQWDGVPDEAFMILVFDESAMKGLTGTVRYRREFDEAM